MSPQTSIAAVIDRLRELVPPPASPPGGGSAAPVVVVDQNKLFDLLAELSIAVRASDPAAVKDAQRTIEDALLRVTCGGWAGPAVRRSASQVLSALFTVGAAASCKRATHENQKSTQNEKCIHSFFQIFFLFLSLFQSWLWRSDAIATCDGERSLSVFVRRVGEHPNACVKNVYALASIGDRRREKRLYFENVDDVMRDP